MKRDIRKSSRNFIPHDADAHRSANSFAMLYLSQVLGRPIRDIEGERVATIKDVIVRLGSDHPRVLGLVARYRRRDFFLRRAALTALTKAGARLGTDVA